MNTNQPDRPDQPGRLSRNDPRLRRMVPLTELRHLYHLLKETLGSTDVHIGIAERIRDVPNRLQELVKQSREHFRFYDNHGEGFHPRQQPGSLSDAVRESQRPVHQHLRRVAEHGIRVPDHPELDANYVDYEVHPLRTTNSEFENGVRCLVSGGVDILMANAGDRLPIVVEQKGKKDQDLFYALIQALTYAVELSTPSQLQRVTQPCTYRDRFAWPLVGPFLDIYLVLVEEPESTYHPGFLQLVDKICQRLLAPGTAVAGMVRRIACLQTNKPDAADFTYQVVFNYSTQQPLNPPTG